MPTKAFCIMSGGTDSTLSAYKATKKYSEVQAIFFDWGQNALNDEKAAVEQICEEIGIAKPVVIKAPINQWDRSDLTKRGKRRKISWNNIMVPERNLVFIALAASYARSLGGGDLILGFNEDDHGYDTKPDFVVKLNELFRTEELDLIRVGNRSIKSSQIRVCAPLIKNRKKHIVKQLNKYNLFHITYSCYDSGGHCGTCPACRSRAHAESS